MRALVAVVVLVASCSSKEAPTMWNNEDEKMSASKVTALATNTATQLGQSLQLIPNNAIGVSGFSTAAKDLVRWKGKSPSDIQPVRIYLGPWQPNPKLPGVTLAPVWSEYAKPTPWQTPEPTQYDAFARGSLFARISFGSGGVQHVAYVDWPPRGLLLQVSANYVQLDAQGTLQLPPGNDPTTLPRLLAHIAPEPGGGDSVQPGTYTYPPIDFNPNPGPASGVLFQIPPFARAFRPIIDQAEGINTTTAYFASTADIGTGFGGGNSWLLDPIADGNAFNREDLPLDGTARDVIIQAVDQTQLPGQIVAKTTINVGCMFLLDL